MNRRKFVSRSFIAAAGLGSLTKSALAKPERSGSANDFKINEYRTLGRTDFKVSDVSFGAGNLNNANVLAAALDMGINYIDTAEHYARGNSERSIGEVLKQRNRKSLFITSKLNFMMGGATKEKLRQRFHRCLERLQTDYVDCLMIHMTPNVDQIKHPPYHEVIRELKAEGRVRFSGLSNHGPEHKMAGPVKDSMEKVVLAAAEDGRFDVALFVYNFIQKEQGEKIIRACKDQGMGVTLMKTNPAKFVTDLENTYARYKKAGRIVGDSFMKALEEYKAHAAPAEAFKQKYGLQSNAQVRDAAIKFVLSNPNVHAVCPTINSFEELETYVKLSGQRLEPADRALLAAYTAGYGHLYCRHACGQCEADCPHGVPVNTIMRYYHYFAGQRREKHAMEHYCALEGPNASLCAACTGPCTRACPFGVSIQPLLAAAHQTLSFS
jgi:predicted aldo/keto reductase-like oxidoreductase